MDHDPLCLSFVYIIEGGTACNCAEIAQIRADEREKAAQRIEAMDMKPSGWDVMWFVSKRYRRWCQYGWDWGQRDALRAVAAARGEAS